MKSLTCVLPLASTACFSCLLSQSPSPPQLSAPQSRRNSQLPSLTGAVCPWPGDPQPSQGPAQSLVPLCS